MPLTDEDRSEIAKMVVDLVDAEHLRRRQRAFQQQAATEAVKVTFVYLITLSGHHLALPGEHGRAILTQCVYARVPVDPTKPSFFGGTIEVIADGDARLFKTPMNLTLTGGSVVGMVQVDESILKA